MRKIVMTEADILRAVSQAKATPEEGEGYRLEELMEMTKIRTPVIMRKYLKAMLAAGLVRVSTRPFQRVDGVWTTIRTYVPDKKKR